LYAAESTTLPTVTSFTGPTSGVVGGTYTFTSSFVSETGHAIYYSMIEMVRSLTSTAGYQPIVSNNVFADDTCVDTCSLSGTFTPTEAGTYVIFANLTYFTGVSTITTCTTHPSSTHGWNICLNSSGKYITFVVTNGTNSDALPSTGILSSQTKNIYIGLGFIALGILATQTFRIKHILNTLSEKRIEKRKLKFEQKF